jgi:hypothetical protein
MGKSFSTVLLAIGALVMVGAGAFVITVTTLGSEDESDSTAAVSLSGEQHVVLLDLGMT